VLSTHLRRELVEQVRTGELEVALAFLSADDTPPADVTSSVLATERLVLVRAREPHRDAPRARGGTKSKDRDLDARCPKRRRLERIRRSGVSIEASIVYMQGGHLGRLEAAATFLHAELREHFAGARFVDREEPVAAVTPRLDTRHLFAARHGERTACFASLPRRNGRAMHTPFEPDRATLSLA
jgi:hypothetical protein